MDYILKHWKADLVVLQLSDQLTKMNIQPKTFLFAQQRVTAKVVSGCSMQKAYGKRTARSYRKSQSTEKLAFVNSSNN